MVVRVLSVLAIIMICGVLNVNAKEPKPSEKTATVLHSDIVAYINGFPIPTHNINGRLAATAMDLIAHGLCTACGAGEFDLNWIDIFVADTYEPEPVNKSLVGTIKEKFAYIEIEANYYLGDDRMKIPALYRTDQPQQIDAIVSYVFLSDVVQALGGKHEYSEIDRKTTVTMPTLFTFEDKLEAANIMGYYWYHFDDYSVGHTWFSQQGGENHRLDIFYKEGYKRDLLADVPPNATQRDPESQGAGYITSLRDIEFSDDGRTMTFKYSRTVVIDLPSAKVISISDLLAL
jgi:hypothetical protein